MSRVMDDDIVMMNDEIVMGKMMSRMMMIMMDKLYDYISCVVMIFIMTDNMMLI